jgi:membrane-bound lytic murein transglycosylase B
MPSNIDEIVNASYHMQPEERGVTQDYRGWDYLVNKLREDGVTERELRSVYQNPEMPLFEQVMFSLNPKESHTMYRGFSNKSHIAAARAFLAENKRYFDAAEKKFGVGREVIAAILLVETHYGKNTGKQMIVNRLSRLATVGEPENLRAAFRFNLAKNKKVKFSQVQARANYLEERFYPQLLALFEIARRNQIRVTDVKGSSAGAFGMPQFLPENYLKFGVDGNHDGVISLYDPSDAILSTARFLAHFKWSEGASVKVKRSAVWSYNPSEAYIDTILKVAQILKPGQKAQKTQKSQKKTSKA